ncbi:scavenger receptor [Branchiostoma belcheri]|nr:scavenger receptor [Branchiostoma belcheri]
MRRRITIDVRDASRPATHDKYAGHARLANRVMLRRSSIGVRDRDYCHEIAGKRTTNSTCLLSGHGTGPIYIEDLQCDGTESSLFNCSHKGWRVHDCDHRDDVGVVCGSSRKEGRVEVRPADSMTWGTVCHNQFDIKDADVVCSILGYPSAQLVRNDAYFGPGRGPIYMDDLRCNGDENSLFNCSYPGWTINDLNCSHDQAAGVECTEIGEPFMLVATRVGIFQVKDGSKVQMSSGWEDSMEYDPKTDFMYWTTHGGIERRARRDGSRKETIVSAHAWPRYLRLDHAGGNVYWSDFGGHISVARKDGSFVRTLRTLQGTARQLVLDPRNGASFIASGGTTSAFGRDTLGGGHQQAALTLPDIWTSLEANVSFLVCPRYLECCTAGLLGSSAPVNCARHSPPVNFHNVGLWTRERENTSVPSDSYSHTDSHFVRKS